MRLQRALGTPSLILLCTYELITHSLPLLDELEKNARIESERAKQSFETQQTVEKALRYHIFINLLLIHSLTQLHLVPNLNQLLAIYVIHGKKKN